MSDIYGALGIGLMGAKRLISSAPISGRYNPEVSETNIQFKSRLLFYIFLIEIGIRSAGPTLARLRDGALTRLSLQPDNLLTLLRQVS